MFQLNQILSRGWLKVIGKKWERLGFIRKRIFYIPRTNNDISKNFNGFAISQSALEGLPNYVDDIVFCFDNGFRTRYLLISKHEAISGCSPCRNNSEHQFAIPLRDLRELRGKELVHS